MVYVLFVIGFVFLIYGAGFLVKGSSSIAKKNNISDLIIGLTIVSLGTSLPELLINIFASVSGSSGIAIGNIFGSNIANVLLILGLSALFRPLPIRKSTIYQEIPFALVATLLVGFLANASLFTTKQELFISRFDGIVFLFFFLLFMVYIFRVSKDHHNRDYKTSGSDILPLKKSIFFIVIGIIGLYFGGEWVVNGAVEIATLFGLSEAFIGLTVLAIGTSLPELVTSIVAAVKKTPDIAVGNVIGSNIFNLLWVLGLSATIKPMPFNVISNLDVMFMVASLILIILAIAISKKNNISRLAGAIFFVIYAAYIYYLFLRG